EFLVSEFLARSKLGRGSQETSATSPQFYPEVKPAQALQATSPRRICSAKYSEARHASAIIQVVMPCVPGSETKQLASVTNKFLTSCDWQYWFSTEVFALVPMRAEPHSCVASPIG